MERTAHLAALGMLLLLSLQHVVGVLSVLHWVGLGRPGWLAFFLLRSSVDAWAAWRLGLPDLPGLGAQAAGARAEGATGLGVATAVLAVDLGANLLSLFQNSAQIDFITPFLHPAVLLWLVVTVLLRRRSGGAAATTSSAVFQHDPRP